MIIAFLGLSFTTFAQTKSVVKTEWFGCKDKDYYNQFFHFKGDEAAFNEHLRQGLATGQCVTFKEGSTIYLTSSTWTGLVQIRKEGKTTSYWSQTEMLGAKWGK